MIKDEDLKLALEALEHLQPTALNSFYTIGARDKAITAIKQALAAPDLQAELEATNRQVEILCDALAESRREVAALKAVQEPVAWEDVLGAIARGWTHPENAQKPMDVQLAVAIAKEIQDMYTTPPAAPAAPLQVSPTDFVDMVMDKEDAIGKPLFWAEWPNKERNHD
jgi:hypothetical protein